MSVVNRFYKIAKKYPEKVAVQGNNKSYTYSQLAALSKKIAHKIRKTEGEHRVLILLERGAYAYSAMFGSLISGGYYSTCNIDTPVSKQKKILEIYKPSVIVSTKELYKKLVNRTNIKVPLINIEDLSKEPSDIKIKDHKYAYVCFTSGSTGNPKGVIISRKALSSYINWAILKMELKPSDRWSQHPNISFDLSVLDIYGALCSGGTLYPLTSALDRMMPAQAVKKYKLTIWNSVPSVINMMIKANQIKSSLLKSLRLASFCGEPLFKEHIENIFKACPAITVHNTYGPTESTVSMTLLRIKKGDNINKICNGSISIGKAITHTGLRLIGGKNKNEGEIVITGRQLAEGYWRLPKETKKSFRKININGKNVKAYFTGDWAIKEKEHIFFKKRIDRQSKIKGFRIELEAIDNEIRKFTKCLCFSSVENNKLYSFIESTKDKIDIDNLILNLKEVLDDYCIPSHFIFMKIFPRNQSDKIDLKKMIKENI